jgi:leucyl/phenylalanyl-tRNA--protein transferase
MPFQDPLSPQLIIAAYRSGYFPMPEPDSGEILWYNPDPRTIIPLENFHISKSLLRKARKNLFQVTFNRDFKGVIAGCAERETTWISDSIKRAYTELHELGFCHSVEVWNLAGNLVGGLYGLALGSAFHAESMFSRETDASKLAIWALVKRMRSSEMTLLEVQFMTSHLKTLGAVEIKKDQYLKVLEVATKQALSFILNPDTESLP